jgi:hypothetical protein
MIIALDKLKFSIKKHPQLVEEFIVVSNSIVKVLNTLHYKIQISQYVII